MKESKFIELLNLYVDHEITAADAALLEAEVQRDPERRRVYREYCQMQKACTQFAEQFQTEAPPAPAVEPATVVAFPRRRFAALAYVGGLAAAACVAAVVLSWNRPGRPQLNQPTPALAVAAPVLSTGLTARPELKPAFGGLVRESTREGRLFAEAERAQFDWLNDIRLQRVTIDQLRFDTQPTLQPADYLLRARRTPPAQAEMTAFRFQR